MKTITEHLRQRLLDQAGVFEPVPYNPAFELENLRQTEWSPQFEQYMRNRLVMGAFQYGLLNAPGKKQYNRMAGARKRLRQYEKTGNLECLVDVANMMLLEFEEGIHPNRHFDAIGDDSHCCK